MEKGLFLKNPELVFNAVPIGIFTLDNSGVILEVNQYFLDMIEITKESLVGKNLLEMAGVFNLDPETIKHRFNKIIRNEPAGPQNYKLTKSNGTKIDIYCRSIAIEKDSEILGVMVFIEEVTKQNELFNIAKENEIKYSKLLEQLNEVLCTIDPEGNILYVSPQIANYGFIPDELINKNIIELILPDDREKIIDDFSKTILTGEEFISTFRILCNNGKMVWFEECGKIIKDNVGNTIGMQTLLRDITTRKELEKTIIENEKKYKTIFDNLPIGTTLIDKDYNILMANKYQGNLFNKNPEEFVGKKCYFEFEKRDSICPNCPGKLAMESQVPVSDERPGKSDNGDDTFVHIIACPILDKSGDIEGFMEIIEDISENKKTKLEIQNIQTKYKNLYDNLLEGFALHELILDESGKPFDYKFLMVNKAFERITNLQSSEIIGKTIKSIMPQIDDIWIERYGQVALHEESIQFEDYSKEIGKYLDIKAYPAGNNQFVTIFQDITKRKEVEIALKKSEEMYRILLDESIDPFFSFKNDGTYDYVNKAFARGLGKEQKDIIGRKIWDVFPSDEANKRYMALKKAIDSGKQETINVCIPSENGNIHYKTDINPIMESNEVISLICTSKNVTEIVNAKEESRLAYEAKSNFLAKMSHEIRTPMNGIMGFAAILMQELKNTDYQEMLQVIIMSCDRLMNTINDILDFSKLESNKYQITLTKTNVISEIKDCIKMLESIALNKNLFLAIETDYDEVNLLIDKNAFYKIINNLVGNALKFTEKGGVTIIIRIEDKSCKINIKDTGCGIPQESFELIFDEFKQASEGYRRSHEGSGLGLSISKKLANLMNGDVVITKSILGIGSIFSIILPFDLSHNPSICNELNIKNDKTSKKHVLVVEDDAINNMYYKVIFKSTKYQVDYAHCSSEALEKTGSKKYNIILMDIGLKEAMNGIDVMHEIKKNDINKSTKIIAVTGYAMEEQKNEICSLFDSYVSKPFSAETILNIIEKNI